ncbi:MAG: hypothetical protein IKC19_03395, partial [Bacteroidales bacterium]|nr:hypothetical protein [Bacteroidales bacterium]
MKTKRFMMMCLAALLSVGLVACDKDNDDTTPAGGNNPGGETPASLVGTYWYSMDGNPMTEATMTALEFETETLCAFGVAHYTADSDEPEAEMLYIGTYTFSGTTGSIHFTDTTFT